jgi:plastocyanin
VKAIASIGAAAVLLAAGCGGKDSDQASSTRGEQIPITLNEYTISPKNVPLNGEDTYTFLVVNKGTMTHALEIEGNGVEEETGDLGTGDDATLTVTLKPGTYEMYCPIDGHRQRGMEGTVVVGGGSGSGGSGTTTGEDTDTSGSGYG